MTSVGRIALDASGHAPGESAVLERALGKDVGLAADVRDEQDRLCGRPRGRGRPQGPLRVSAAKVIVAVASSATTAMTKTLGRMVLSRKAILRSSAGTAKELRPFGRERDHRGIVRGRSLSHHRRSSKTGPTCPLSVRPASGKQCPRRRRTRARPAGTSSPAGAGDGDAGRSRARSSRPGRRAGPPRRRYRVGSPGSS